MPLDPASEANLTEWIRTLSTEQLRTFYAELAADMQLPKRKKKLNADYCRDRMAVIRRVAAQRGVSVE